MKGAEKIFAEVALEISPLPSEAKREKEFAAEISKLLEKNLKGEGAECAFVGSAARDTGLRADNDLDLFVQFPRDKSEDYIVKKTFEATRRIPGDWVTHYAEHPYLQAQLGDFRVEVIPCFRMAANGELKSAVDRSPLHMAYLQDKLTPLQRRDVRLLKKMLKTAGIYGAEISIEGFSGLLCEYLVLDYRNLENLIESAAKWKAPVFVDLEGFYIDSSQPEFDAPLVLIDAIDKKRNVAAVLSETNFHKFVSLCQAFRRKPSRDFFFRPAQKNPSRSEVAKKLKERGTHFLLLSFPKPQLVEDILVPQLRKTACAVAREMRAAGFSVVDYSYYAAENCGVLLELAYAQRPSVELIQGPPVREEAACLNFSKAHKNALRGPFVKGDRIFVEERVAERSAKKFVASLLKNTAALGVGANLSSPLKAAALLEDAELNAVSDGEAAELWKYLAARDYWL